MLSYSNNVVKTMVGDWKNPQKQKKDSKYANIGGCIFRVYGEKKPLDGSRPNFVCL